MHSATTRARTSNTSASETGRVSRQTMPLPSRHQALTPKSSAAPLAVRPGSSMTELHCSPATRATRPGPAPEHEQAAAHADRAPDRAAVEAAQQRAVGEPQRGSGAWRASWTPDCDAQLLARRLPERPAGGAGAEQRRRRPRAASSTRTASGQREVCIVSATQRRRQRRGPAGTRRPARWSAASGDDHDAGGRPARRPRRAASVVRPRPPSRPPARGRSRPAPRPAPRAGRRASRSGGDDERGDGEQAPELDQPGEVERRQHQGAEVLGDRADRVDRGLARATAARARRRCPSRR